MQWMVRAKSSASRKECVGYAGGVAISAELVAALARAACRPRPRASPASTPSSRARLARRRVLGRGTLRHEQLQVPERDRVEQQSARGRRAERLLRARDTISARFVGVERVRVPGTEPRRPCRAASRTRARCGASRRGDRGARARGSCRARRACAPWRARSRSSRRGSRPSPLLRTYDSMPLHGCPAHSTQLTRAASRPAKGPRRPGRMTRSHSLSTAPLRCALGCASFRCNSVPRRSPGERHRRRPYPIQAPLFEVECLPRERRLPRARAGRRPGPRSLRAR